MVELVRAGRTPEELSREFEPTAQTIHNWVKQADIDAGASSDGHSVRPLRPTISRRAAWGIWLIPLALALCGIDPVERGPSDITSYSSASMHRTLRSDDGPAPGSPHM
jgi:hypothetical protein